jgi:hypothetical protein
MGWCYGVWVWLVICCEGWEGVMVCSWSVGWDGVMVFGMGWCYGV